jgi:signal transduction histidine kinase
MKIGTRITITTVLLVLITLSLYGYVSVRARRIELAQDLERQTSLVGAAVQVAFEAALQDGLFEDVSTLIKRWQEKEPNIGLAYIDIAHQRRGQPPPAFRAVAQEAATPDGVASDSGFITPRPDPTRSGRLTRIGIDGQAAGEHITLEGRSVYALTVPVRDSSRHVVGAIELTRDESDAERALANSLKVAIYSVGGLSLGLALLVWLSTRSSISSPLKRLVEAIDDVTHGDLGRVILRERDDEVGDLAERFNEMTGSLREAREQILDGVDAKLALEARLRHSEKLATIGQLAAGIAHEVGTPLNVIGGRARTMEKKAADPAEVAKNAAIIAAQTQRITKIIQQLLDFARRPSSVRTAVNLQTVGKDCLDFLEHQLTTSRVETRLGAFASEGPQGMSQPIVTGDADQLQQVCLNLCLNAIQAMPEGGRLHLSTRAVVRRRPGLETSAPAPFVVLDVADTGVGIPEADRERIFEPFYSTKSPPHGAKDQGGTGLGLAVSVGIIKDHDGWIEIDSRPGEGTTFHVFLPALDPEAKPEATVEQGLPSPTES